jgi:hypothetical protein
MDKDYMFMSPTAIDLQQSLLPNSSAGLNGPPLDNNETVFVRDDLWIREDFCNLSL